MMLCRNTSEQDGCAYTSNQRQNARGTRRSQGLSQPLHFQDTLQLKGLPVVYLRPVKNTDCVLML